MWEQPQFAPDLKTECFHRDMQSFSFSISISISCRNSEGARALDVRF